MRQTSVLLSNLPSIHGYEAPARRWSLFVAFSLLSEQWSGSRLGCVCRLRSPPGSVVFHLTSDPSPPASRAGACHPLMSAAATACPSAARLSYLPRHGVRSAGQSAIEPRRAAAARLFSFRRWAFVATAGLSCSLAGHSADAWRAVRRPPADGARARLTLSARLDRDQHKIQIDPPASEVSAQLLLREGDNCKKVSSICFCLSGLRL